MADGSIRIDATVSDEQAKKQIAQMTKDIEKQSAAVDKQAAKVQKLAEQWNKVAAGGTKGIKMQADLAATEKEAARLAARLDEERLQHQTETGGNGCNPTGGILGIGAKAEFACC